MAQRELRTPPPHSSSGLTSSTPGLPPPPISLLDPRLFHTPQSQVDHVRQCGWCPLIPPSGVITIWNLVPRLPAEKIRGNQAFWVPGRSHPSLLDLHAETGPPVTRKSCPWAGNGLFKEPKFSQDLCPQESPSCPPTALTPSSKRGRGVPSPGGAHESITEQHLGSPVSIKKNQRKVVRLFPRA